MLRGLAFYGTGAALGAAGSFYDPTIGAVVTQIPVSGDKDKVVIRGATLFCDTIEKEAYAKIKIGSDGDYHDIDIRPRGDADNPNAMLESDVIEPLGDFVVRENNAITVTLYDADGDAEFSGVLWYDDMEPELFFPKGRIISVKIGGGADAGTALSTDGGETDICGTYKFNVSSLYYVVGGTFYAEDKVPQVISIEGSGKGNCAVMPLGRSVLPSCPLKFKGNETVVEKLQVKAATKVYGILRCIEVPGAPDSVANALVESRSTISNVLVQTARAASNQFNRLRR